MSRTHDAVVLAIPFTTLRAVDLDIDLDRVPGKRAAIDDLGYGTNAKMMVGFERAALDRSRRQRQPRTPISRKLVLRLGDPIPRASDIRSRRVDRPTRAARAVRPWTLRRCSSKPREFLAGSEFRVSRGACRGRGA